MGASAHESQGRPGPAFTGETPVIHMGKMPHCCTYLLGRRDEHMPFLWLKRGSYATGSNLLVWTDLKMPG